MKLRIGMAVVVAAALAAAMAPAALGNYVYWPNYGGTTIGRMALDGSQRDNSFIATQNNPVSDQVNAVALDSQYVYWSHGDAAGMGAIGRAKLDGTDVQPNFIPHSVGINSAFGVAVTATHIYWTDNNAGTIGRADISGANPNPSFITDPNGPCGLAADDNFLYFSAYPGVNNAVARVPIGGGTPNDSFIPVPSGKDCGVAIDGSHVYWVEYRSVGIDSLIGRANLNGTQVQHPFIDVAGMNAYGVAVTPQNVYWGSGFSDHSVGRAGIDGSAPNNLFAPIGTGDSATPYMLAASPSNTFTVGKATLNKKSGTAKITATVQGPGVVVADAASKGAQAVASKKRKKKKKGPIVKRVQKNAAGAATVTLKIQAKGKALKALKKKGKAKIQVGITFTPQGVAGVPALATQKIVLRRR